MYRLPALNTLDMRALFNASPNPYVLLDRDLRIAGMNGAYLAVTMRQSADLLGRPLLEAFPSDPGSVAGRQLRQSLARVLAEGCSDHLPSIHYPIARPDGTLEDRYWSATHVPLPGPDGRVQFVLQHTVDVTELVALRRRSAHSAGAAGLARVPGMAGTTGDAVAAGEAPGVTANVMRRAQALQAHNLALGEQLSHLRGMFEQAPGFIVLLRGADHVFEIGNAAYQQLVGHRAMQGLSVREALPELQNQGFFDLLDQVYRSGQPFIGRGMVAQLQRQPGAALEQLHVDFIFQPLTGEDGQVSGIFVQGHDITEQFHAQRAALESEERFRTLAHAMPNMVWTARPGGGLDWCNTQVAQYSGLPTEQLLGNGWTVIVHAGDLPLAAAEWQRAVAAGTPYQTEFRLRRHDGLYRWHIARALPLRDAEGQLVRWIGTNTDIEDQKASAALLADLNNQLARRVEERTAELQRTQEALRQSQKLEAIGKLAGGIAHDFNNLLQVITGNLNLLAHEVGGRAGAEHHAAQALAGAARGAKLASQLLSFGRRQPLAPEVVQVGHLVAGMHHMLRGALGEGVQLHTVVAPDLWPTLADPGNLENALLNLAINARDAMDGHGRLTVEAHNAWLDEAYCQRHPDLHPGPCVAIAVSDTGCGMAPELAAQAFEPFFTTKPAGKGTGLGLSMVYGFAKQSGGHVKLYSEPGMGTTVKLYLPRSRGAQPVPAAGDNTSPPGGNETVLVVEDDDAVRHTTVALLAGLGYQVLQAADAAAALHHVHSAVPIHLLFTDVVMPGPLKTTQLVDQATRHRPGLQVLYTSGYAENAIVHGGRLDAGVHLLSKPYTREALARKLRQLLGPASQQPKRPASAAQPAPPLLRVLLCEDDALVRQTLVDLLGLLGCQVEAVATASAAQGQLERQGFDLLVTDLSLPDGDGHAVALAALAAQPALQVAIASGMDTAHLLGSLPGAQWLAKPFDTDDLTHMVEQARQALAPR